MPMLVLWLAFLFSFLFLFQILAAQELIGQQKWSAETLTGAISYSITAFVFKLNFLNLCMEIRPHAIILFGSHTATK